MTDGGAAAVAALVLGDPAWTEDLIGRLRTPVLNALALAKHLPPELFERVIACDDVEAHRALARNECLTPDAAFALAALGKPELGVYLYLADYRFGSHVFGRPGTAERPIAAMEYTTASGLRRAEARHRMPTTLRLRSAVLAAADPADPRWRDRLGLVERVLYTRADALLVPALRGPFPELVAHALRELAADLTPAVLLDTSRRLAESDEELFDAFVEFAEMRSDVLPHLAGRWRDAVASAPPVDAAAFAAHLLLLGLRHLDRQAPGDPQRIAYDDDEPWNTGFADYASDEFASAAGDRLPWEVIRAEHARRPFTGGGLAALTRSPHCPADLVAEAYREEPGRVLAVAPRVPLAWITAFDPDRRHGDVRQSVLSRGLAERWLDPAEVLATVAPAVDVFAALPLDAPGVREAVAELAARLGTDSAAWAAVLRGDVRLLGTAREFVDSAADRALISEDPSTAALAETAFQVLFACAEQAVQEALFPSLPPRGLRLICKPGVVSRAVRAAILASGIRGAGAAMAAFAEHLSPDETAALLDLDDSGINSELYARAPLTREQRVRIASGTDRHGRPRTVSVAREVAAWDSSRPLDEIGDRMAAARQSGHPVMLSQLPRHAAGHTLAPRLRMLVRLWERGGPEEVRDLLHTTSPARSRRPGRRSPTVADNEEVWPEAARAVAHRALDAGPDTGLDQLRAAAEDAERPEAVIAELRAAGRIHQRLDGDLPWPEIVRAHAERPFGAALVRDLLENPCCPAEFHRLALRDPTAPVTMYGTWPNRCLASGVITVLDLANACVPASTVLRTITAHAAETEAFLRDPAARELIRRVRAQLDRPDAWVVAVRLLPDFTGTLMELATVAAAAASPQGSVPSPRT